MVASALNIEVAAVLPLRPKPRYWMVLWWDNNNLIAQTIKKRIWLKGGTQRSMYILDTRKDVIKIVVDKIQV